MDGDDVRVAHGGEDPCLSVEACGDHRVARMVGEQDFDRDVPFETQVPGVVDGREPARTDPGHEPVPPREVIPDEGHGPRVPDAALSGDDARGGGRRPPTDPMPPTAYARDPAGDPRPGRTSMNVMARLFRLVLVPCACAALVGCGAVRRRRWYWIDGP